LPEEWKELIIVSTYKKGNKSDCSNYRGLSRLPTKYEILSNILLSRLTQYGKKKLAIISVDFDATDLLMIIYFTFFKYLRRNGNRVKQCISCL
jgi:hypothetical protein